MVLGDPNVVVENESTPRSTGQNVIIPCQAADTCGVASHASKSSLLSNVPQFDAARVKTDSQIATVFSKLD